MQDRIDIIRTGRMLYRPDAVQDGYRTGEIQDRTDAGHAGQIPSFKGSTLNE